MVLERIFSALSDHCNVDGGTVGSILFAAEKTGSEQLIDTAHDLITPDSVLMYGTRGRPAGLNKHIKGIAQAFRRPQAREDLPLSIGGVWKADLFVGATDTDRWVGTTVKINADHLEGARGLRIGIVPAKHGKTDLPHLDDSRNLVVCPLLHDGDFMQIFYEAWTIVQQFLTVDARMPKEVALPRPPTRQVARLLAERREFPVLDVVSALYPLAQPELLQTEERQAHLVLTHGAEAEVQSVVAPFPLGDT